MCAGRFPRLDKARQAQVRDGKAAEAGLRSGPASSCPFVTNFAAGARCRAGKWRNSSGMVVCLDFDQELVRFFLAAILAGVRRDFPAFAAVAAGDCGVITVGRQDLIRVRGVRGANQRE